MNDDKTETATPERAVDDWEPPLEASALGRVGEYLPRSILATGGFGAVYEGEHVRTGQKVAIKILHADRAGSPDDTARFFQEVELAHSIRHPNIVDIYASGVMSNGRPYLIMELLPGETLSGILGRVGTLSPQEALKYLRPVCEALEAVHAQGVVHRDIKGGNILVSADGQQVKLLDFGIAKVLRPDAGGPLTRLGQRLGTPAAMAPEQIVGGGVDGRADIYALGVLLFRMLTHRYPFEGSTEDCERMHLTMPPPRPGDLVSVSPRMDQLVLRCMEKEPANRFQSVREFLEELTAAASDDERTHPRVEARTGRALAFLVHSVVNAGADPEEALYEADESLAAAEELLTGHGFQVKIRTGNVLLATTALTGDERHDAELTRLSLQLREQLTALGSEQLQLRVVVHRDEAQLRTTPEGDCEITGGRILEFDQWTTSGRSQPE